MVQEPLCVSTPSTLVSIIIVQDGSFGRNRPSAYSIYHCLELESGTELGGGSVLFCRARARTVRWLAHPPSARASETWVPSLAPAREVSSLVSSLTGPRTQLQELPGSLTTTAKIKFWKCITSGGFRESAFLAFTAVR